MDFSQARRSWSLILPLAVVLVLVPDVLSSFLPLENEGRGFVQASSPFTMSTNLGIRHDANCATYAAGPSHDCTGVGSTTGTVVLDQCNPEVGTGWEVEVEEEGTVVPIEGVESSTLGRRATYFWMLASPFTPTDKINNLQLSLRVMCSDMLCGNCQHTQTIQLHNISSPGTAIPAAGGPVGGDASPSHSASQGFLLSSICSLFNGSAGTMFQVTAVTLETCSAIVSTTTVSSSSSSGASATRLVEEIVVEVPLNQKVESPAGAAPIILRSSWLSPPTTQIPALNETLVNLNTNAPTTHPPQNSGGGGDRDVEDLPPSSNEKPENKRRRPYAIVIATVLLAIAALIGYVVYHQVQAKRSGIRRGGFSHLSARAAAVDINEGNSIPDNFAAAGLSPPISPRTPSVTTTLVKAGGSSSNLATTQIAGAPSTPSGGTHIHSRGGDTTSKSKGTSSKGKLHQV